jgi:hypothetical protein
MRRYLLLVIVPVLMLPPAAIAGSVEVGTMSTGNRYDPTRPAVVFTAAPGERNQIVVARDGGGGVVLRDGGAVVQTGPGCTAIDAHTVRCGAPDVAIDAGDRDDSVTIPSVPPSDVALGPPQPHRSLRVGVRTDSEVHGGDGDDSLTGWGRLAGGPGADTLTGGPAGDVLLGGTGDDVLRAGAGADQLIGDGDGEFKASPDPGGGDDTIDGGDGQDLVLYIGRRAGVRVDLAAGTAGRGDERDRLSSIEDVIGGLGADVLLGDGGPNWLYGDPGDDRLDGRAGNDTLTGGRGTDTLRGGAGDDALNTRERVDRLFGGAGDDTLQASYQPANVLSCGRGSDTIDGEPSGQVLDGCERVKMLGVTLSVRPQRRVGGALRFAWTCVTLAADSDNACSMTVTLRLRSTLLASRKVSLSSPSSGSFLVRPRRSIQRGRRIDVTIAGGLGTRTRIVIPINARWRVRL